MTGDFKNTSAFHYTPYPLVSNMSEDKIKNKDVKVCFATFEGPKLASWLFLTVRPSKSLHFSYLCYDRLLSLDLFQAISSFILKFCSETGKKINDVFSPEEINEKSRICDTRTIRSIFKTCRKVKYTF